MNNGSKRMSQKSVRVSEKTSIDGQHRVEVVKRSDGNYSLRTFEIMFDPEEGVHYEVEVLPTPIGIFADATLATAEAERLIALKDGE